MIAVPPGSGHPPGPCQNEPMKVRINGEWSERPAQETVAALLEAFGLDPRRVAVERNLELVPKARYGETGLSEGDRIEIVHFVGGG